MPPPFLGSPAPCQRLWGQRRLPGLQVYFWPPLCPTPKPGVSGEEFKASQESREPRERPRHPMGGLEERGVTCSPPPHTHTPGAGFLAAVKITQQIRCFWVKVTCGPAHPGGAGETASALPGYPPAELGGPTTALHGPHSHCHGPPQSLTAP